jgi:muconolactone delta-isomerase
MANYMMVCTFTPDAQWDEVTAMVAEEQVAAKTLQDEGRLLGVRVSVKRDKVFLDVVAEDETEARATVGRLPMSRWWDLEAYEIASPV